MRIVFIHQNFPAQFKHLAPALAADPANKVLALTTRADVPEVWRGVHVINYQLKQMPESTAYPMARDFERKVIMGKAALHVCQSIEAFQPDIVLMHPGWGEGLFVKDLWPNTKLVMYSELYFHPRGLDEDFDPEFIRQDIHKQCQIRLKNAHYLLQMEAADAGLSPMHWQAQTFPSFFRDKIKVIHEGIDTTALTANPSVQMTVTAVSGKVLNLSKTDQVVTLACRNLEPYRGYHVFMRALPELLRQCPKAIVLLVGGDGVSYGPKAPAGHSWKDIFFHEVKSQLDLDRVCFLGHIPYSQFVSFLQLSTVHVYLTYPSVLSWSVLEAMSCECAIVASDTPPLQEVITHHQNGRLFEFFDRQALVSQVADLLANPAERRRLGANARTFAQAHYDLRTHCLPAQLAWIKTLVD